MYIGMGVLPKNPNLFDNPFASLDTWGEQQDFLNTQMFADYGYTPTATPVTTSNRGKGMNGIMNELGQWVTDNSSVVIFGVIGFIALNALKSRK